MLHSVQLKHLSSSSEDNHQFTDEGKFLNRPTYKKAALSLTVVCTVSRQLQSSYVFDCTAKNTNVKSIDGTRCL